MTSRKIEAILVTPTALRFEIQSGTERAKHFEVSLEQHPVPWAWATEGERDLIVDLDGTEITEFSEFALTPTECALCAHKAVAYVLAQLDGDAPSFPDKGVFGGSKILLVALAASKNGIEAGMGALQIIREAEARTPCREPQFWFPVLHEFNVRGVLTFEQCAEEAPEIEAARQALKAKISDPGYEPFVHLCKKLDEMTAKKPTQERRDMFEEAIVGFFHSCIRESIGFCALNEETAHTQAIAIGKAHVRVLFDHGFDTQHPEYASAVSTEYHRYIAELTQQPREGPQ